MNDKENFTEVLIKDGYDVCAEILNSIAVFEMRREAFINKIDEKIARLRKRLAREESLVERRGVRRAGIFSKRLAKFVPFGLDMWLKHDTWSTHEAFLLFSGIDPKKSRSNILRTDSGDEFKKNGLTPKALIRLDNIDLSKNRVKNMLGKVRHESIIHGLIRNYRSMETIWQSGHPKDGRFTPSYFVAWAINKNFYIPWLEWAGENGLLPDLSSSSAGTQLPEKDELHNRNGNDINECPPSARVYWRRILAENFSAINDESRGRVSPSSVIKWLKINGGDRILPGGGNDEIIWKDENGGRQVVVKKTIANAISEEKKRLLSRLSSQSPA